MAGLLDGRSTAMGPQRDLRFEPPPLRRSTRARARGAVNTLATLPKAQKKAKPGAAAPNAKGDANDEE